MLILIIAVTHSVRAMQKLPEIINERAVIAQPIISELSKAVHNNAFDHYFELIEKEPIEKQQQLCNVALEMKLSKKAIHFAAEQGNIDALRKILQLGGDINSGDINNKTPFLYAAEHGRLNALALLFQEGADASAFDREGMTAVHWAIAGNKCTTVITLIEDYRLDVNRAPSYTLSSPDVTFYKMALHQAAQMGHVRILEVLLHNGALIDAVDNLKRTALHVAALKDKLSALLVLLTYPTVNPNARDSRQRTPLHYAAQKGNFQAVVALLRRGAHRDVVDDEGTTILHFAARSNKMRVIAWLLKEYCLDVHSIDNDGWTPLGGVVILPTRACLAKFTLLCAGAKLNNKEYEACKDHVDSCLSILETQADTETCLEALAQESLAPWNPNISSSPLTPLMKAIKMGCSACVQVLLKDPRTDPNIQDDEKRTALHLVVMHYNDHEMPLICEKFLNLQRTNVSLKDSCDKTARQNLEQLIRDPRRARNNNLEKLLTLFNLRRMRIQLYLSLKNVRCTQECEEKVCHDLPRLPADICMKITRFLTTESLPRSL